VFEIWLRVPAWCSATAVLATINGSSVHGARFPFACSIGVARG
jgi:hypothetical protein